MDENTINTIARKVAAIIQHDITPVYDKPLYTIKEAAVFLGVKRSYIYELVRANRYHTPALKAENWYISGARTLSDGLRLSPSRQSTKYITKNQSDAHD